MLMKILLFLTSALTLTSCNTFRKTCESYDWYKHAYDAAREGRRLSGDQYLTACRKKEAEISEMTLSQGFKAGMGSYCTPKRAFEVGFDGKTFNYKMCDSHKKTAISKKHGEGVTRYCAAPNGYKVGASGKKYTGICNPKTEKAFMPEYAKGRKIYLNGEIQDKTTEIKHLDGEMRSSELKKRDITRRLRYLPRSKKRVTERHWDPIAKRHVEKTRYQDDPEIVNRRRDLEWQSSQTTREIDTFRQKKNTLRQEILSLKKELRTIR